MFYKNISYNKIYIKTKIYNMKDIITLLRYDINGNVHLMILLAEKYILNF